MDRGSLLLLHYPREEGLRAPETLKKTDSREFGRSKVDFFSK
jgi:hypothetical protein